MIRLIKYMCLSCLLFISTGSFAQQKIKVTGKVYSADSRLPLNEVLLYSKDAQHTALSDSTGSFTIEVTDKNAWIRVTSDGYQEANLFLNGRQKLNIYLVPAGRFMYNATYSTSEGKENTDNKIGNALSLNQKDMNKGYASPEDALTGRMAGLRIINKSGMPGEGSLVQMRGLHSLLAENVPLIVVDGVPYLPDLESSSVINGYSKGIFAPVNMKDVESITLLKGADAAAYGSMGSNGVLLIETERSQATSTEVQVHLTNGVGFMKRQYPLMNDREFKTYIADIGSTRYSSLNDLVTVFPFLRDDPTYSGNYLYNHNTDWQKEVYSSAVTSESHVKVSGGDAVASYALSVGYLYNKGLLESTKQSKYYTRLNGDVNVRKNFKMFVNAAFNYGDYDLQETGLQPKTNPMLAAIYQAPVLSVYEQNREYQNLPHFNPTVSYLGISNPAALISDVEAKNTAYDILVDLGFNYNLPLSLKLAGVIGIYYNYSKESMFVPGNTSGAIAPLEEGIQANTIRSGASEGLNYYVKMSLDFDRVFRNIHSVNATLGYQLMSSRREMDWGAGLSKKSDFYKTLGNVDASLGRTITGYLNKWNWMDFYLKAKYGFKEQLYLGATLTMDAASPYGKSAGRVVFLPTAQIAWNLKNSTLLQDAYGISRLMLRGEYGVTANSRFSAKYGRYYYQTEVFRNIAGMVRQGLPNTNLKPERVVFGNVGADLGLFGERFSLSVDLFRETTKDLLFDKAMGAAYGYKTMYRNDGELKTDGIEATFHVNLLKKGNFQWYVGGNIAHAKTTVESLGGQNEKIYTMDNGAVLISRVGEAPYSFYGHVAEKVFATQSEINRTKYISHSGDAFQVGDIKFRDVNGDRIIGDDDRMVLGNSAPDFFGGFYTNLTYKGFNLFVNFAYSYGNKVYNAVRKAGESMDGFENQFSTVVKRWMIDGQQTDMPRAVYGDPMGNSRFSSRWIDDGSFLRMKEVTLSYEFNRRLWFFNNLKAYLTGENLVTWTKYVGLDPEFGYSYDPMLAGVDMGKVPLPKMVKLGLVLNF